MACSEECLHMIIGVLGLLTLVVVAGLVIVAPTSDDFITGATIIVEDSSRPLPEPKHDEENLTELITGWHPGVS